MEELEDEIECLKSIYPDIFTFRSKTAESEACYDITLSAEDGSSSIDLHLDLPSKYPYQTPVMSILKWKSITQQEIRELQRRLSEQLVGHVKGETVGFELISACQEWFEERASRNWVEPKDNEKAKKLDNEEDKPATLSRSDASKLAESLIKAGFKKQGFSYLHTRGVTVMLLDQKESENVEVDIQVAGLRADDIYSFATLSIGQEPIRTVLRKFGKDLLTWVKAQRNQESPGFVDEKDDDHDDEQPWEEGKNLMAFLPDPSELGADSARELTVLTWGNALKTLNGIKAVKTENGVRMQRNFSASGLNGRGGNVDLRTMNGRSEEVQHNVARSERTQAWMRMVVERIERENLQTIAVNCTKGRHRSVAAAELLRKYYYPKAIVRHLTIR